MRHCFPRVIARSVLVLAAANTLPTGALADLIPLLPTATYLRTNADAATSALIIPLEGRSLSEGSQLTITICGDFKPGYSYTDTYVSAIGVFSSTNTLLAADQPHRVPGALDAGIDFATSGTWYGNLPTDIPEDFKIGLSPTDRSVTVDVPAGANFLMVSTLDSQMQDNSDPDHDWAVSLTVVPEPSALTMIALAATALVRRRV